LVTGAGGFIGSHLVRKLSTNPETKIIYAVDLKSSKRLLELAKLPKVKILELDLCDPRSADLLPEEVSAVFSLAALNGTSRFYSNPWTVLEASTLPTLLIIRKYSGRAPILYTSSSEVYAGSVDTGMAAVPTKEEVILSITDVHNPRWSYAMAKMHGEMALVAASKELGLQGSIVRYHNVYGKDMGGDHFIPDFIGRVMGGVAEIHGGENTRSFLHIDDAVSGTILALGESSSKVPIFHLGTDDEMTIENAARRILKVMGRGDLELIVHAAPLGSVLRRCPDTRKAQEILDWYPKISFDEGIKMVTDEYQAA
jgi:nucleoside-diphosphate-sugar epimerase